MRMRPVLGAPDGGGRHAGKQRDDTDEAIAGDDPAGHPRRDRRATATSSRTASSPRRAREHRGAASPSWGSTPSSLDEQTTKLGAVETCADAHEVRRALPRARASAIDGVLVALPNFGDEKGVADTLRWQRPRRPGPGAGLSRTTSAASTWRGGATLLRQDLGLQQPAPVRHPVLAHRAGTPSASPTPEFRAGPRVVPRRLPRGARAAPARLGAIGARPAAFNTVRYSEKLLERAGHQRRHDRPLRRPRRRAAAARPTTRAVDGEARRDPGYADAPSVPQQKLAARWRRLAVVVERLDARRTTSTRPRSSAGTRSRRTTASTPARS